VSQQRLLIALRMIDGGFGEGGYPLLAILRGPELVNGDFQDSPCAVAR
jgi:hypothetical protein